MSTKDLGNVPPSPLAETAEAPARVALRALIGALEKATEGSRELDGEIWRAIGMPNTLGAGKTDWHTTGHALHYTTSLDAALTLIPSDARLRELGQWWDVDRPGKWYACVMQWRFVPAGVEETRHECGYAGDEDRMPPDLAPSAALALCIAALKARDVS